MVKNQPRPGKAFGLVFSSNSHGDVIIMPYKDRLESWAVIRLLPKMQRVTVPVVAPHLMPKVVVRYYAA